MLLAMAVFAAIIMPAALLEDDDLLAFFLGDNFSRNGQALEVFHVATVSGQQNVVQSHRITSFAS